MKIKLDPWGTMPTMGHPETDAGWDLYSPLDYWLSPGESIIISTGVHIQLPNDLAGFIKNRSSVFKNKVITDGLIDPGYIGEIGVTLINVDQYDYHIHKGDRIAQLVIVPIVRDGWDLVDELAPSKRGYGGFGSTGR